MLFVCVPGVCVTYMGVISWAFPFIPELLPSEARVLYLVCRDLLRLDSALKKKKKTLTFVAHCLQGLCA